jgi:hypothetical protein
MMGLLRQSFKAITAIVYFKGERVIRHVVCEGENIVVMPEHEHKQFVLIPLKEALDWNYCRYSIGVDCTDLSGVSEHSFLWDQREGLKHFFGFKATAEK